MYIVTYINFALTITVMRFSTQSTSIVLKIA